MARGLMEVDSMLPPQIVVLLHTEVDDLRRGRPVRSQANPGHHPNPEISPFTDSFYANVRGVFGLIQSASVGRVMIDIQGTFGHSVQGYVCSFHSSQDSEAVGLSATRGYVSLNGVASAPVSLYFLEKSAPNLKWVEDKNNSHRRGLLGVAGLPARCASQVGGEKLLRGIARSFPGRRLQGGDD